MERFTHQIAHKTLLFTIQDVTPFVLGRSRTFMVYSRDIELHLPTDIAGVTGVTYSQRSDKNMEASLGPVCTRIKQAMGVYESENST